MIESKEQHIQASQMCFLMWLPEICWICSDAEVWRTCNLLGSYVISHQIALTWLPHLERIWKSLPEIRKPKQLGDTCGGILHQAALSHEGDKIYIFVHQLVKQSASNNQASDGQQNLEHGVVQDRWNPTCLLWLRRGSKPHSLPENRQQNLGDLGPNSLPTFGPPRDEIVASALVLCKWLQVTDGKKHVEVALSQI